MALGNIYRVIQDVQGNIVPEVLCTVLLSGTSTLATLFADQDGTVSLPNPLANNSTYGSYSLFVAAGLYDMQFVKAGYTFETQRNIDVSDPAAGVTSITGTANQVLVSPAGGVGMVTLSTPQNLDPDASVQFSRIGIGTTPNPSYSLDVVGPLRADRGLYVPASSDPSTRGLHVDLLAGDARRAVYTTGTAPSVFIGPVGIGVDPPAYALDVSSQAQIVGGLGVGTFPPAAGQIATSGGIGIGGNADPSYALRVYPSVRVRVEGPLGVGTDPGYPLHVAGQAYVTTQLGVGAPPQAAFAIVTPAATQCAFGGPISVQHPGGTARYTVDCDGNAGKPGGGAWIDSNSLRKFKRDIRPLTDALQTLLRLAGRQWEWAEDYPALEALLPGIQTGFVIEEVQEAYPAWVMTDLTGEPGLAIRGFEALCIESLRELVTRLTGLEARVGLLTPEEEPVRDPAAKAVRADLPGTLDLVTQEGQVPPRQEM